MMELFRSQTP